MKKFLFAVAALATSLTASAQLWVSGSLGLGNQSTWNVKDTETTWNFSPSVGYALDDALEVGLSFGIGGTSQGDDSSLNFSIAPFARYTFLSEGDFSMFIEGNVSYGYNKDKKSSSKTTVNPIDGSTTTTTVTNESKNWSFGINLMPGIKYAMTDQFAIVAKFGALSFLHKDSESPRFGDQNGFGINIDATKLEFALVYSF